MFRKHWEPTGAGAKLSRLDVGTRLGSGGRGSPLTAYSLIPTSGPSQRR